MLPDLSLLLAIVFGLFYLAEGAAVDALRAAGGTAAIVLVVAAVCRMSADRALRGIDESEPAAVMAAGARLSFYPLLGWFSALAFFDWGAWVAGTVPPKWPVVPYLLFFAPLFAMFASGWVALRRIEQRLSPVAPSRWGAVGRGLRRNALTLLPLGAMLLVQEAFRVLAELDVPGVRRVVAWRQAFPDLEALVLLVVLAALMGFAPAVFRRVLHAEPLPAGELRTRIEALLRAMGVGFKDVLLWKTNRRVVNAMVVGLTGGSRYVFVTDGLLAILPAPEVLAVVAHEAGHAKRRHLPLYFVASLALVLLLHALNEVVGPSLGVPGETLVLVLFLAVFWFGLLGWLSRRFEREADVFGAEHAGDLDPAAPPVELPGADAPVPHGAAQMIGALARLHAHVGVGGRHHRHGSPPDRVAFLARHATDAATRREFDASSRKLRLALGLIVLAAVGTTAARLPGAFVRGDAALAALEGLDLANRATAAREKDPEGARRLAEQARARFRASVDLLPRRPHDAGLRRFAAVSAFNAADVDLHRLDRPAEAAKGFAEALAIAEDLPETSVAPVRFDAHVDLGRLALRDASDLKKAVLDARLHLQKAKAVPEALYGGDARRNRLRLLESAISLRDDDPAEAQKGRDTLAGFAAKKWEGEAMKELGRDAAEELRLATPR